MSELVDIAVVEDEEAIHELFKMYFKSELRKKKYRMHFFLNGQECFDYLKENQDNIKILLILSDINMPVMDGFGLLELTQKHFPSIQTFLISAYDHEEYISKAESLGATNYLTKPVDFDKLKDDIDKFLEERKNNDAA